MNKNRKFGAGSLALIAIAATVAAAIFSSNSKEGVHTGSGLQEGLHTPTPPGQGFQPDVSGPLPPTDLEDDWSCSPVRPGEGAFRTIMRAGDPTKLEGPPYRRIAGPNSPDKGTIQDETELGKLGYYKNGGFYIYKDDGICYRRGVEN